MLSALLALHLAAAIAPVAPAGAPVVLVAPQAQSLAGLRAFLDSASVYAPSLTPAPLGRALGSALSLDAFDLASWPAAGLDPDGPVTLAFGPHGQEAVLILPVKDAKKVAARARVGLGASGHVEAGQLKGGELIEARRPLSGGKTTLGGAVGIKGHWAALLVAGSSESLLRASLEGKAAPLALAKGLTAPLLLLSSRSGQSAAVGLAPKAGRLDVDGRLVTAQPLLAPTKADPYAGFHPTSPAWGRAALGPAGLAEVKGEAGPLLRFLVVQVCRECAELPLTPLLDELAGPSAYLVQSVSPERVHGQSDLDRFFLMGQAQALQVRDAAKAHAALAAVLAELHAHHADADALTLSAPGEHYRLRLGERRALNFGLAGDALYWANADDARDALLSALPAAPGQAEHPGLLHLEGPLAARALNTLSLLDAARSNDLAALFAMTVEAGPLLKATGASELTLDTEAKSTRLRGAIVIAPPAPGR